MFKNPTRTCATLYHLYTYYVQGFPPGVTLARVDGDGAVLRLSLGIGNFVEKLKNKVFIIQCFVEFEDSCFMGIVFLKMSSVPSFQFSTLDSLFLIIFLIYRHNV